MNRTLWISEEYRHAIFRALALQVIVGFVSLLILDGGQVAQICGVALVAFWGGVIVLIWRHPTSPTDMDILLIRYGYLAVLPLAGKLLYVIWEMRGVA